MRRENVRSMVLAAMMAAVLSLCAWLSVPVPPVSVTMQTFGVFLTLGVLGGKWGTLSILLYLLLGVTGLPVFSGFRGGLSALTDAAGGFLWGFLAAGLIYWALEKLGRLPAMAAGQLTCYLCGCGWFTLWAPGAGWRGAVLACVAPYLIPDIIKLILANRLSGQIRRQLKIL